jgi:hypothetical protein
MLAIVRKVMILDLATTDALQLFALATAIGALGAVHCSSGTRTGGTCRRSRPRARPALRKRRDSG